MSSRQDDASPFFVAFISSFTALMEAHIVAAQGALEETVEQTVKSLASIRERTQAKKDEADQALFQVYTTPDDAQASALNDVQDSVDAIFQSASMADREEKEDSQLASSIGSGVGQEASTILENKLRRMSGKFSKQMEAMSTLDNALNEELLTVMEALAMDNGIGHRLEHVRHGMHALTLAVNRVLKDYDSRCAQDNLSKIQEQLLEKTFQTYTFEDERQRHQAHFAKKLRKVS